VIGRWGYFCNLGIKLLISPFLLPPPINPRVQQPLPLSFPFSFFLFFSLISRMFHLSSPYLSFLPLLISFFVLHAHTHTQSKRERELLYGRRGKTWLSGKAPSSRHQWLRSTIIRGPIEPKFCREVHNI
jgi:hypothetical protein